MWIPPLIWSYLTLTIETDMPKQTVDLDQMLQNVASDQGLQLATHPAVF